MKRYAHSAEGQPEKQWEPLSHHLSAVGLTAGEFAQPFGASLIAQAMGLLHDIGKCSLAYQNYIRRPRDAGGQKGPDHSTAGAKEALAAYGKQFGKLMAFGIAGHHSGLMDGSGHEGTSLSVRRAKVIEDYAGWQDHVEIRAGGAIGKAPKSDVQTTSYGSPTSGQAAIPSILLFPIPPLSKPVTDNIFDSSADVKEQKRRYDNDRQNAKRRQWGQTLPI